jgi:hypothetical protein
MPGFDGTGPGGMGPMTGGGRGYCNPGSGWTGYRFPRRYGYTYPHYGRFAAWPAVSPVGRDEALRFLKSQAAALKRGLEGIDERIAELAAEAGSDTGPSSPSAESDEDR